MHIKSLESLPNISELQLPRVIESFRKYQGDKTVLLLDGPMGSGKTTFTRKLLESYGFYGAQSPTFALHNRYSVGDFVIEHLDLFRMKSAAELDGVGFWDFFYADKGLIIIEWSERMDISNIDSSWKILKIAIQTTNQDLRSFELSAIEFADS